MKPTAPPPPPADDVATQIASRDEIEAALRAHDGRVASAARALGMHRNQLRRWLSANQVDPRAFASDPEAVDDEA